MGSSESKAGPGPVARGGSSALSEVFERSPIPMAVLEGPELRFARINPAYVEWAKPEGGLVGRPFAEVFAERADLNERLQQLLLQKEASPAAALRVLGDLEPGALAPGSNLTCVSLHGPDGRIEQVIALARDRDEPSLHLESAQELAARVELERARLKLSYELTGALSGAFTRAEVAHTVFVKGLAVFGADAGALALFPHKTSDEVELVESFGYPPSLIESWKRFPLDLASPITEALRLGRPAWVGSFDEAKARFPDWAAAVESEPDEAWAALPLVVRGRVLGAIGLSYYAPRRFDPDYQALILSVADKCAQALDRAQALDDARRHASELAASEERFRILADESPFMIWMTDSTGSDEFVNRAYREFFGTSLQQLRERGLQPLLHPDDAGDYLAEFRRSLAYARPFRKRARVRRADGAWRYIESHGAPRFSADGAFLGLVGASPDRTEQVEAEAALNRALTRLEVAKDAAQLGIFELDLVTGRGDADDRLRELLSLQPGEAPTRDSFLARILPDDRPEVEAVLEAAGCAENGGRWRGELRVIGAASRWLAVHAQVVFDEGRPSRLVGSVEDITSRRRAKDALERSERRLRWAQEAGHVGVFELDLASEAAIVSRETERLFGLEPASDPEEPRPFARYFDRVHPDDVGRVREAIRRAIEADEEHVVEYRVVRPNGEIGWLLSRGEVTKDAEGRPEKLFGALVDVTERRVREEAVRAADRRKTEFLAVISHELRNPLAALRNGLTVLERVPSGTDAAFRASSVIRRQTDQLARLVDDLLDISRINLDEVELRRARLDAREVVVRTCEDMAPSFEQHGVRLQRILPPSPVWIEADPVRLAQMVGNLLHNALKFTPGGGRVAIEVRRAAGCEIRVVDTGAGIEPMDLERIFDPFAQVARAAGSQTGGFGVGLALVRKLAALHGGSVSARSDGPGTGAEFVIALPSEAAPTPAPRAASKNGSRSVSDGPTLGGDPARPRAPSSAPRPPVSVLIIEDNEDAAETLSMLLELDGHDVRHAATGRAGLDAATDRPPDVVICDIGLPDLSGYEVIRALRASPLSRRPFAIALTGYAQGEDRKQALEAGFDAHMAKPPALSELRAMVNDARPR